jgi:hypothetical protein
VGYRGRRVKPGDLRDPHRVPDLTMDQRPEMILTGSDPADSLRIKQDDDYLIVRFTKGQLQITSTIYETQPGAIVELLGELAENWRGWSGDRTWQSVEGDLQLSCRHDGRGHVTCTVTLQALDGEWRAEGDVILEAGQLDRLHAEASRALGG